MALTTITGNMVSVNAIQGTLIADNAITAVHIASNAVTSIQIAENNVTAREIASNSITVAQLADASVESDKIANGVITTNHLNSAMISSQTEVTAVAGDFVLLGDTSDSNNLKKTPVSSLAPNALPLAGGAMTGAITTNSTFDGVDIAVRDAILTSTTTTAGAALPKAGGTMTGNTRLNDNVKHKYGSGDYFQVYHDGTNANMTNGAGHLTIDLTIADKDFIVKGTDGVADITALTLDMSAAGFATFNNGIRANRDISAFGANTGSSANRMALSMEGSGVSRLICNGPDMSTNGTFEVFTAVSGGTGSVKLGIDSSGNVGIGTASPSKALDVRGGDVTIYGGVDGYNATGERVRLYIGNNNSHIGAEYDKGFFISAGNSAPEFHIRQSTGYVGIGTDAPAYPLEIANNSTLSFAYQRTGVSAKKWGFDSDNAATYWVNITDNVRPLTLLNGGNIGIGTLSPGAKLEISGKDDAGAGDLLRLQFDNSPADTGITFTDIGDTVKNRISMDSGNTNDLQISAGTQMSFHTSSTSVANPRMTIDSTGNVGIGTTGPTQSLEVVDSDNYKGIHIRGSVAPCLTFAPSASTTPTWRVGISGYDGAAFAIATGASTGDVLHIKNNGNVGIGTTSPAYPLHVNGTLHVGISGTVANNVTGTLNIGNTGTYYMTQIKAINVTGNPSILNTRMGFFTLSGTGETVSDSTEKMSILAGSGNVGIGTINPGSKLTVNGSFSKSSGSFRIDHPLEAKSTTHDLVHSFVEAPQADNIYRGKVDLVNGSATVNIDTVAGMTEGTFVALNREVQCFTTNESNWDAVKGSVSGNILTIESQNSESTATISWLVIGERQDSHMYDTEWTDDDGKVIVEPLKETLENA